MGSLIYTSGNMWKTTTNHGEDSQRLGQNVTLNFPNTKETIFCIQNNQLKHTFGIIHISKHIC